MWDVALDGDAKNEQQLDTLDAEGNFILTRSRDAVHKNGFWHRYVHVWVIDLSEEKILLQHLVATQKPFGGLWTCCSGHVLVGEPSLLHAAKAVETDLKLSHPETSYEFVCSCKEVTETNGVSLKQMIDVYILPLERAPKTHTLALDCDLSDEAKYVTLAELQDIYRRRDPDHALISNPEYSDRLFRVLAKSFRVYWECFFKDHAKDEKIRAKADRLVDTFDENGTMLEPTRRADVDGQSLWHRAVHIWVLDTPAARVLLLQRSRRKRDFARQWNCSYGRVDCGESSLPSAVKSVQEDTGLSRIEAGDLEFVFQARNESDTGGGVWLKQHVDVFCATLPSDSYPQVPAPENVEFDKDEVEAMRWFELDELEQIWAQGKAANPQFVCPSSPEYSQRLFYLLRQKVRKFIPAIADGAGAAKTEALPAAE